MPWLRFIPETTNVDFVKYRWWAFTIDGLLMVVSVVSILWQGFNLGIDFTGGTAVVLKFEQNPSEDAVRSALDVTAAMGLSL